MAIQTITLITNSEVEQRLIEFYRDFAIPTKNPYAVFAAKVATCVITLYTSHKVTFQGDNAVDEASIWNGGDDQWVYTASHMGSDEVGTGDYFGPVVVAAAYITDAQIPELIALGVKDSKKLTDALVMKMAPQLIKILPHSILVLDNPKFNDLTNRGFNMNRIKAYLHNQALLNLQKKLGFTAKTIVVDQFTPKESYFRYLNEMPLVEHNIQFVTKAESLSPAVAAASVLARYTFLKRMHDLSTQIGIVLPKGAGAQVDDTGRLIFETKGAEVLKSISKFNFKNTHKILQLVSNSDLEEI